MMKCTLILLLVCNHAYSQFAPGASQPGTTAINKDSSVFINWAAEVVSFNPGPEDLTNNQSPLVSFGVPDNAIGQAEGNSFETVSLGDGGSITVRFEYPIINAEGPDFAVFENSFSETYLEFAFVEVSTNGTDYVRFHSTSNIQTNTQTGAFDSSDPALINNLAGKYKQGYGVPFDLNELIDSSAINIDSINFVRIIDVVGSVDSAYGNFDSNGNIINDPFPSPFNSSGFDLDAIGVIHQNNPLDLIENYTNHLELFPNPAKHKITIRTSEIYFDYCIYDSQGRIAISKPKKIGNSLDLENLSNGIYFLQLELTNGVLTKKFVIQK